MKTIAYIILSFICIARAYLKDCETMEELTDEQITAQHESQLINELNNVRYTKVHF